MLTQILLIFKSLREEAPLDLSATKMTEFSDGVLAVLWELRRYC